MTGRGSFITFEGGDGSGKSTQIKLLEERLLNEGVNVVVTREPGGTSISEKIREIILDPENDEMVSTAEMLLYAAARAQLVNELIIPSLATGKVVICDRFLDSSIVYQGIARGLGSSVRDINAYATESLVPDLTVYIEVDPEVGLSRSKGGKDRIELQDIVFHRKVADRYKFLAEKSPGRIKTFNGEESITEIKRKIWDVVAVSLAKKGYSVR